MGNKKTEQQLNGEQEDRAAAGLIRERRVKGEQEDRAAAGIIRERRVNSSFGEQEDLELQLSSWSPFTLQEDQSSS